MKYRPRRRADIIAREMEDEILLYDPQQNSTHLLNPTAAAIWELCDGTRTPEEMAEEIVRVLPADRPTILSDVKRIIREFSENGLLQIADPPADPAGPRGAILGGKE